MKLKAIILVLLGMVPVLAVDVAPFVFSGASGDAQQEQYWKDLMQFKFWGTQEISIGRCIMLDSVGAVGTAGNFIFTFEQHAIGGPIYAGGNISGGMGGDIFTTGPARVNGSLLPGDHGIFVNGAFCGNISNSGLVYTSGTPKDANGNLHPVTGSKNDATACASVPAVPTHVTIPTYTSLPSDIINMGNYNSNGASTVYIDIPPKDEETGKKRWDFLYSGMTFSNTVDVIVRMENANSYARFFIEGNLSISSGTSIRVAYVPEGATYDFSNHRWNNATNSKIVNNKDYVGNMIFYTTKDLNLGSRNGERYLQGTYMTSGTMTLGSNTELAGQLLATKINVGAEFKGDFVYMPFEAPLLKVNPNAFADGAYIENDEWVAINMSLDAESVSPVYFDYCFATNSYNSKFTASNADFNLSGSDENGYHEMPICGVSTGKATISAKSIYLDKPIYLNVKLDTETEVPEIVGLRVYNMVGAMMEECDDNGKNCEQATEGIFPLTIVDANREPVSEDNAVSLKEDESFIFTDEYFAFSSQYPDVSLAGVNIVSLPENGVLLVGEEPVVAGANVALADLQANLLTFKGDENWYGTTAFSFKIYDTKEAVSKEAYTMTITVTPVNDAPVVTPATIRVTELKHIVDGNVTVSDVDDADNSTFTFAFDETDANYEKVSALYTWDNANRTIVLKNGKTLNYESADSSLTIAIKVTDAASTTNGTGKKTVTSSVTIKIVDENEMPVVTQDPAFAVDENVANDLAGSIFWADPDSENDLFRDNKIVIDSIKNASGEKVADDLFVINVPVEGVGNVSVNGSVNYESSSYYTLFVRIYDDDYSQKFPIVVNVNNQNENPEFACAPGEDCNGPFEIDENSAGPVYADLVISDPDNDGLTGMTAALSDNGDTGADTLFDAVLDGNKVSITVIDAAKLDFEKINKTHEVVITVTDAGGLTASIVRTITVNDLNEPFELAKVGDFEVAENAVPATAIGKIVVTDEDIKNETFRDNKFEIVSVKDAAGNTIENQKFFALEEPVATETGSEAGLKVVSKLNFEESKSYVVTVRVFDNTVEPEYSKTIDITVGVDDQNENPEFACAPGEDCNGPFEIDENSAGPVYADLVISDPDNDGLTGMTAALSDNGDTGADTLFDAVLDGNKVSITVKDAAKLDFEKINKTHEVVITVTDAGGLTASIVRTITVNDLNEPFELAKVGDFEVAENAVPATAIGKIVVTDEDIKNETFRDNKFEIVSVKDAAGNTIENQKFFALEEPVATETGSEAGLKVVTKLNFEESESYVVTVRVFDNTVEPEYSKTIDITVGVDDQNENPEFACAPGEDCNGPFEIDENSAGPVYADLVISDPDNDGLTGMTVALSDNGDTGADTLFDAVLDGNKVSITVKDAAKLDFEKINKTHEVVITVTDAGGLTASIVRTITVNDLNEPFTLTKEGSFVVAENVVPDTAIGTVIVLDEDSKNPDFRHNDYDIVSVVDYTGRSIDNEYFKVDGIGGKYSGDIGLYVIKPLDYEKSSEYTVKVAVFDMSAKDFKDTITITISLQDVNENPEIIPDSDDNGEDDEIDKCKKNDNCVDDSDDPENPGDKNKIVVGIEENSATGTEILSYKVVDQDDGDVDKLTATIEETDGSKVDSLFKIDVEKVGEDNYRVVVSVADSSKLDYEKIKHEYDVVITVADEDGLTDTIVRTIKIIDVNENPIIAKQEFDFNENEPAGTEVGQIKSDDLDTAEVFKQNVYTAVAGDTALFNVSKDGVITTTKEFNYEAEPHSYVVVVKVSDKKDPKLFDLDTMVIALNNVPETPEFKNTEFDIDENVPDSTKIGTVVARDPDGRQELTYSLVEKSDYVIVTKSGDILVKDSSLFDYETIHEIKVKVRVTDPDKLHSDTTITIHVNDVNEAPIVKDQEFFVDENSKKNTVVGQVEASDLDTAKIFSTLTFELVGESNEFQVTKNGTIKTTKVFDYEADSLYTIKVLVTDGEFTDTAVVKIHVNDLYEKTQVEIIEADNRDSCWSKNGVNKCSVLRDTVYTNLPDMNITWTVNGEPQTPDAEKLHEGVNIIIKTYDDPTMNEPGADTLVVIYSTAAPIVTVSTKVDTVEAENIFTVVEQVDARDTNVYVNNPKKDIRVTVKDTVLGTTESFVVKLNLDTVNVSKKDFTKANDIVESGIALNIKPASEMTYTPVNGTEVKVSYTEKVNGETVTVSYLTDNDGEIKKTAVLTDEGTIDSIEVITVTYVTKVDGKDVSLSYKADAVTGEALLMSTDGGLMTASAAETFTGEGRWDDVGEDSPGSSSSKSGSKSDKGKSSSSSKSDKGGSSSGSNSGKSKYTVAGLFSVTYDYEDESGNTVTVAYTADSKGSMVKNAEGNVGYNVSYSYTNPFGNTASQAVFIVIDQVGPVVEILSPVDEEVVYTNSVEVTWTVNGIVQDTLALQGLDKGANGIVRFYCDKAGNCDSSIVYVIMKNAKDVDISVEKPVTKITQDLVDEYYEANPPKKGETFAVSIKNAQTGDEVETLIGGDFGSKVGSEDTPYPGLKGHLGPTLGIDIKVPTYGGSGSGKAILSGLATFDELVGKDGMVNIDGVDAAKARKVTVEEFVEDYCSEEFADSLGTDYSRASLYKTTMYVNVWVYTSLGSFVDYFSFNQDLNDPDYADDAGLLKLYFEMKPDKQGYIRTESGKRFGTGSYVYKTEVEMRSTLQCTLPPVDKQGKDANKVGAKRKVTDNLLKSFGYRRPEKR